MELDFHSVELDFHSVELVNQHEMKANHQSHLGSWKHWLDLAKVVKLASDWLTSLSAEDLAETDSGSRGLGMKQGVPIVEGSEPETLAHSGALEVFPSRAWLPPSALWHCPFLL